MPTPPSVFKHTQKRDAKRNNKHSMSNVKKYSAFPHRTYIILFFTVAFTLQSEIYDNNEAALKIHNFFVLVSRVLRERAYY